MPVLEATEGKAAGATKAAAQGRRAARAKKVFMVLGGEGCGLCVRVYVFVCVSFAGFGLFGSMWIGGGVGRRRKAVV